MSELENTKLVCRVFFFTFLQRNKRRHLVFRFPAVANRHHSATMEAMLTFATASLTLLSILIAALLISLGILWEGIRNQPWWDEVGHVDLGMGTDVYVTMDTRTWTRAWAWTWTYK